MSSYPCEWCQFPFSQSSNRSRHKKNCPQKPKITATIKKKPLTPVKKEDMIQQITELRTLMEKIHTHQTENPTVTTNNLNMTINNFVIIESTKYEDIVNKFGKEEAVRLLTNGRLIDVAKKLYFDGIAPDQYPVACRENMQFRFLNGKSEMVIDDGGSEISRVLVSTVQNAMLSAINSSINDHLQGIAPLADITDMQDKIAGVKQDIKPELSKITYNPDHPFFKIHS